MDKEIIQRLAECEKLTHALTKQIEDLNSLLKKSSELGIFLLIDKKEHQTYGKNNCIEFFIRKSSFDVIFSESKDNHKDKPGGF